jgi:hypothetical protein
MGVYYRVAAKCDSCKSRIQFDTKCFAEFEKAEKTLLDLGCSCGGKSLQTFKSVSTVDWSCLDLPYWSR